MMIKRSLLAVMVTFLLAACRLLPTGAGQDFNGEWILQAGTHDGAAVPILADGQLTLTIDGTTIGGRAACNIYGGTIAIDGSAVTMSAMSMSEMACDEPRMASEAAYMTALADVTSATRAGDQLTLSGEGVELTYTLVPPVADAELAGTVWVLDSLIDGEAASSVAGDPATLEFADDGTLTGSTGCRAFGASYSAAGDQATVTDLVNDDRGCADELTQQDEHVLAVLADGFNVTIDGNRLTLTAGERGLGYTAQGS